MKTIPLILAMLIAVNAAYAIECDYSVEILKDSNEFTVKDFKFKIRAEKIEGPSTNITGRIYINDENGNIIRSYKPWTNSSVSKQKTSSEYSPDLKEGIYGINAEITVLCDDFGKENNVDRRKVTIKSQIPENTTENKTESTSQKENQASFEGTDKKSNETKELQPLITEETPVYAQNQENSKEEYDFQTQENQISAEENAISRQSADNQQTGRIVYESGNEKSRELIIYMLVGISILLNIFLIWRKQL